MRVQVIGSAPAVWGFALTGVQGRLVETAEALHQALDEALADATVGIILISEDVARLARTRVDELTMQSEVPLIVEIPGPDGVPRGRPPIDEMLHRMLGVDL